MNDMIEALLKIIKEYQEKNEELTENLNSYRKLYFQADNDLMQAEENMKKQQRTIDRLKAEKEDGR